MKSVISLKVPFPTPQTHICPTSVISFTGGGSVIRYMLLRCNICFRKFISPYYFSLYINDIVIEVAISENKLEVCEMREAEKRTIFATRRWK